MLKFISLLASTILFLFAATLLGGQSGYIMNGKVVVTHKDGVPVDEDNSVDNNKTSSDSKAKSGRQPAAMIKMNGFIQYEEDDFARCYWLSNKDTLQCIKKAH